MNTQTKAVQKKSTGVIKVAEKKPYQLSNPDHIASFSGILERFIKAAKLSTIIQGNEYVNVDGWKFAGINFGLTAIVSEPIRIDEGKTVYYLYEKYIVNYQGKPVEKERVFYSGTNDQVVESIKTRREPSKVVTTELFSYKCSCDIISLTSGEKVGFGFAICSNAESKKVGFDEFAIASQAQTRAIGKGYRNLLGFIMKAAGFSDTPSEEMEEEKYTNGQTADVITHDLNEIDSTTQQTISECKTLDELQFIWNKNKHLHSNNGFLTALGNKKKEINSASNNVKVDMK